MKKCFPYIGIFILGMVIGWLCRDQRFNRAIDEVQRDTIVKYNTIRYTKLELETKRYQLDMPNIKSPELVYIPADSTTIIYRDSVRYVTMPRQYFYTKVDDAEIWHSGIDSTIDSLNVVQKTKEVVITTQKKPKKNFINLGVEANYYDRFFAPAYIEYERKFVPWLSVYGRIGYNIPTNEYGVGAGARLTIGW